MFFKRAGRTEDLLLQAVRRLDKVEPMLIERIEREWKHYCKG
ncbi:hypothetical protein GCWU000246_00216 [Jonquetella anthropi E3_33 E1]|nr:hypothetical protein GCWU000246_00216 [Jonquetella anthropi E3_33 E1]